jgi:hypothetical protein
MPDQKPQLGDGDEYSRTLQSGKVLAARVRIGEDGQPLLRLTIDGQGLNGQRLREEDAVGLAHFVFEVVALASAQPEGWPFET